MLSKNRKKFILAAAIFICFTAVNMNLKGQVIKNIPGSQTGSNDSLQTLIQDKISFYQAEQKKNMEAIEVLQKELEQRRALNERLNGAVAAAQDLLNKMYEKQTSNPDKNK